MILPTTKHSNKVVGVNRVVFFLLDTFGEEVSGLGNVVWGSERTSQLFHNTYTGGTGLAQKSEKTHHGNTSVLGFLQLLLGVLLRSVVETERVPTSLSLSPALGITDHVVGSILQDVSDSLEFKNGHEGKDLWKSKVRDGSDSLQGVGLGVGVQTDIGVSGEVSQSGEDETKSGNLGDTSVHQLDFTVPFETRKVCSVVEKTVEVVGHEVGTSGKEAGVETDVTRKRSIKGGRGVLERKGNRRNSSNGTNLRKG